MSILEEHGPIMASADCVSASELEALTAHERAIVGVVAQLRADIDAASITAPSISICWTTRGIQTSSAARFLPWRRSSPWPSS